MKQDGGYGFNKKLDDEDKELAYLKYEFVYGTYDFSQIIWDILYDYLFLFTISAFECLQIV